MPRAGGVRGLDASTASTAAIPRKPGDDVLRIYTTRPDTLFGATYMVIAPEHPLVERLTHARPRPRRCEAYCRRAARKSDLDRTDLAKEKTGVFTGSYAVNPVNGKAIPIWVADYVLISYGTGAIMAVPGPRHPRLRVRQEVRPADRRGGRSGRRRPGVLRDDVLAGRAAFIADGTAINSGRFNGLSTAEFKQQIADDLANKGLGRAAVNYKLRDWLFSRQHFWGEPFPILHELDAAGQADRRDPRRCGPRTCRSICREQMTFDAQHDSPEPPLEKAPHDWLYVTLDGKRYKRETNTMPQWAGSCWYYLRFLDPKNDQALVDPRGREGLDAGRSVRGRGGARRAAPALRPLLAQGALRPRLREHARAVPEAGQPGDDPGRDGVHRLSDRRRAAGSARPT